MPALEESSLSILGQEVPLGRVDKALKELWGQDDARTRASLMNFSIYSEDSQSLEENTQLLAEITHEHACRGLLILSLPGSDKQTQTRAWITAHCQLHDGHKSVCSEQISFVLYGSDANRLRNIVFAHLDSDLPLVLWWQGNFSENFDERLYSMVDLLFIDSSCWTDPAAQFARLQEAQSAKSSRFSAYDLSWLRSHLFRTALATCFQLPAARAELPKLQSIDITHAKGQRVAAQLIVAWIAMRLKANLETASGGIQMVLPEGQKVAVTVAEGSGTDALQSLVLQSASARFRVSRDCGASYVCTRVELGGQVYDEMLPADLPRDADLIGDQLSRIGGKSLYGQMVPMLLQMQGA